jgi:molybdopterin molybdotransferase
MDRLFRSIVDLNTARNTFFDKIQPIKRIESIPIENAQNRVLASEVIAECDVPHYRRAAMDGYAVKAADTIGASTSSPVVFTLTEKDISPVNCKRVHTGSAMPPGADAVVMLEDTRSMNTVVEVMAQVHPEKHVGGIGEDVAAGERLFSAGHQLRPWDLAVLVSTGIVDVEVFHRPLVTIIPTGEEVVERGTPLEPGQVWETNSLMTASFVRKIGGIPRISRIVTDDLQLIKRSILTGSDADMIIISGGTSVGERDYVPAAIETLGELLVHGVAISPGKPTALGVVKNKPVLCMPGYPVAGLIALLVFGKEAIRILGHFPKKMPELLRLPLKEKITSRQGYHTFVRVQIKQGEVEPLMASGAGILSSVARADGYVVVPPNVEGYSAGTVVDVFLF